MLKKLKEDVVKGKKAMNGHNVNINKKNENLKRNQKETLKLKSTIT